MTDTVLESIEVTTGPKPTGSVIWLHGLGADGHDFEPIVPQLPLGDLALRFVFPHAPERAVTINDGMTMRAWYDIDPRAGMKSADADIEASARAVEALISAEVERGIDPSRIVLAGFSQGGVIALHTALRYRRRLAGIMALSTYLHDHEHVADALSFENLDVPILFCHGLMDPMIPITRAITARETLLGLNFNVEWHEYAMGHQVCPQEIKDIGGWLRARFS